MMMSDEMTLEDFDSGWEGEVMSDCKHIGWSHTVDGGNEWCAWCEIERLRSSLEDSLCESERLTAEVDKKGKRIEDMKFDHEQITALEVTERDRMRRRIEELEQDRSLGLEERGYHIITTEQLASGEVVLLTQDQIDAAWVHTATRKDSLNVARWALKELNIVACEECGGSGHTGPDFEYTIDTSCHSCHGHGWKVVTGADLMVSGDWVDDREEEGE